MSTVEEVCRLCLASEGCMEPIFNSSDPDMPQKIWECTSVEVRNLAGLPSFICEICKSELIIWLKFRRQCLRTNEMLKYKFPQLFSDVGSENHANNDENKSNSDDGDNESYIEILEAPNKFDSKEYVEGEIQTIVSNNLGSNDEKEDMEFSVEAAEEEQFDQNDQIEVEENEDDGGGRTIEIQIERNLLPEEEGMSSEMPDSKPESSGTRTRLKRTRNKEENKHEKHKVVLPNNQVRYVTKCSVCGKDQLNIKQHMRIHLDEKPYKCSYCGRAFRQRGNYTRHVNIHTGAKPYKCTQCEAAFADPASLRAHWVRHTGSREYHCDVCGKWFSHSHVLAGHKRIHTQDRRHPCSYCDKRFLSGHALKKHIRTHTGERPFKCKLCPKAFSTSGNLRTHQKVHTKDKPFKCKICKKSFAYRCVLKTHMKTHGNSKDGMSEEGDEDHGEDEVIQTAEKRGSEKHTIILKGGNHSEDDQAYGEVYEVYMDDEDDV